MKKTDLPFILLVIILFLPFFVSQELYDCYKSFNAQHGMIMSFVKFSILSTMGEMIGLRISTGSYIHRTFGLLPRMVVWGVLGMGINMSMIIFSKGVPLFLEYMGMESASQIISGPFCLNKVWVALAISVAMNTIFAPVFMTFHKISDIHIANHQGSVMALFSPIPVKKIMGQLNWEAQWKFVFKKTIPLFWYPAHTITFLLPPDTRVLFAALLGVALGILLAIASKK